MATIKMREVRDKSAAELQDRLRQLKKELYELRLAASTANVEKPHQFRLKKKEIAKILTVLEEREDQNVSATRAS
jgi:large subunit ribosomal protein L29